MIELTTTLCKIVPYDAYLDDQGALYKYLGKTQSDDEPLPLRVVLDAVGLYNALYYLRGVDGYRNAMRLYGCHCAWQVLPDYEHEYPDDLRPRKTIETAERYAHGQATDEELLAAEAAAYDAAKSAVESAAAASVIQNAARMAAIAAAVAAYGQAASAARAAALYANPYDASRNRRDYDKRLGQQTEEFLRLCHLEGEYGGVAP